MPEEETSYEVLDKKRAFKLTIGDNELVALKLPSKEALGLGGLLNMAAVGIGVKGEKAEENNWLVLMKDTKGIVKPYEVWAKEVGEEIADASGNYVSNVSLAVSAPVSAPEYETIIVESEEELEKAYTEGWCDPTQYTPGKWILRRPKFVTFI